MNKIQFSVPNIHCNHCVHTIQSELSELAGVKHVEARADTKQVNVDYEDPATEQSLRDALAQINYPAK